MALIYTAMAVSFIVHPAFNSLAHIRARHLAFKFTPSHRLIVIWHSVAPCVWVLAFFEPTIICVQMFRLLFVRFVWRCRNRPSISLADYPGSKGRNDRAYCFVGLAPGDVKHHPDDLSIWRVLAAGLRSATNGAVRK